MRTSENTVYSMQIMTQAENAFLRNAASPPGGHANFKIREATYLRVCDCSIINGDPVQDWLSAERSVTKQLNS